MAKSRLSSGGLASGKQKNKAEAASSPAADIPPPTLIPSNPLALADALKDRRRLVLDLRSELMGPMLPEFDESGTLLRGSVVVQGQVPQNGQLRPFFVKDGEGYEELLSRDPKGEYGVGVLHPKGGRSDASDPAAISRTGDEVEADVPVEVEIKPEKEGGASGGDSTDEDDSEGDDLQLDSSLREPCSMAISVMVDFGDKGGIKIGLPRTMKYPWNPEGTLPVNGVYVPNAGGAQMRRRSLLTQEWSHLVNPSEFNGRDAFSIPIIPVEVEAELPTRARPKLQFQVRFRKFSKGGQWDGRSWVMTVALVNVGTEGRLYQSLFSLEVEGTAKFLPYPTPTVGHRDEEEAELRLLYRDFQTWGTGHGCSAAWDPARERHQFRKPPARIWAEVFPIHELPSVEADAVAQGKKLEVTMDGLASAKNHAEISALLSPVLAAYQAWGRLGKETLKGVSEEHKAASEKVSKRWDEALARMERGLELLENPVNFESFRLANAAMMLQQVTQKQIKRRELALDGDRVVVVGDHVHPASNALDEKRKGCKWRAFQIAFMLMAIPGAVGDEQRPEDRELVDLIWFPTGGGKTEAYLGLASFTMFLERLKTQGGTSCDTDGVNIIMRYTLRMLTGQQFQRASSLIFAMEWLHLQTTSDQAVLAPRMAIPGQAFRIGLWVGGSLTPNRHCGSTEYPQAKEKLAEYEKGECSDDPRQHPFVLTECPWCRARIGGVHLPVDEAQNPRGGGRTAPARRRIRSAGMRMVREGNENKFVMHCPDSECAFHAVDAGATQPARGAFPALIVDEDIYELKPSMVIATADKFAMCAFKEESRALFGLEKDGGQISPKKEPPCLILQDELHLISGPLGSLFGLYECAFHRLFERTGKKPRIVSSTATVRGLEEQVLALWGREKVQVFPPPGPDVSDSFFGSWAFEADQLKPGRMYVGVLAPGHGSLLTTQVRAFSSLLMSARVHVPAERRDPWWTLLCFYNAIRELGGGRTLFDSDIQGRIKRLWSAWGLSKDKGDNTAVGWIEELSSRQASTQLIGIMDRLTKPYVEGAESKDRPHGACLATNIIEVGVDIDRLSLMAVVGQPKSVSQYIQVTGRVGRKHFERPGLVVTMYSPSKPRDRSMHERFQSVHQALYAAVEPTSATPFSAQAIERALHAVAAIGLRLDKGMDRPWDGSTEELLEKLESTLGLAKKRIGQLDEPMKSEADSAFKDSFKKFQELCEWGGLDRDWSNLLPTHGEHPLFLVAGKYATAGQREVGLQTMTSLRNVDGQGKLVVSNHQLGLGNTQQGGN